MRKSANKSKISSKEGFLVILSAPSGCGKTTILKRLLQRHPEWIRSVSVTTRPPRPGEKKGKDYEFITKRQFESLRNRGEFLEWARVFGQGYGTRKRLAREGIEKGRTVLLAVDIQGHRKIRKAVRKKGRIFSIFILPPSVLVLRERLEKRHTDSEKEIEKRIEMAKEEIKTAQEYDATVVNHDLDQTVREMEELIENFDKEREGGK